MYGNAPKFTDIIRERRTRFAGHYWQSKAELVGDILLWIPKYGHTQVGRPYKTYINQFALDTCMQFNYLQSLETNSQRGSGNLPNPVR